MPGDVQIRQLEYLVALAHERHFGRAAAACHASQPALSGAIRKLEIDLGVTIVQRGRRFAGFTPEGRRVVGWAHRILAERDALRSDLGRMHGGLTATLRIGAIPTAIPVTALLTEAFCARHPHARVRVEAFSSRDIGQRLAEFDLDVGLTYLDSGSTPDGTTSIELYRERYLLLTPDGSPLTGHPQVSWADAAALPLCTLTPAMRNRQILDTAVAADGARLSPVVETDTVAALYAHLGTGRSSIIAHTWLRAFGVPPGMCAIPMAGASPRPAVGLVTTDRQPASILAAALLEAVAELDVTSELEQATRTAMQSRSMPPGDQTDQQRADPADRADPISTITSA